MGNEAALVLAVEGKNKVGGMFGKIGGEAGGLAGKLKSLKLPALAAAGAVVGLGAAVIKFGGEFNAAFKTIAVGTGATGEALDALKEDFKAVFAEVPVDMQTAAKAIADFNTLTGASGEPLQKLAKQALNAARALGEDVGPIIDGVGKTMNIFGLDAVQGGANLDIFFKVAQDSGVPLGKLTKQLQTFGPILKNTGLSAGESAKFFGDLNKAGVDVSRVMPALNSFTRKLAAEGVEDLKGGLTDMMEIIRDAPTDVAALSLATDAFGAEGAQRMTNAIREGGLAITALGDDFDAASGVISRTAAATEGMGEKFTRLKNKALVAIEPLMTKLFDGMLKAMDWLTPKLAKFTEEDLPRSARP